VAVFTSSKEELNKADIRRKSASFIQFSGKVDSKGRVTVPARIRDKIGVGKGDRVSLILNSREVVQERVEDYQEALDFVRQFESIQSFSFEGGLVEVVLE